MVEKFKDAANILKAKLKKDDLEENLVQATSQQNWQAPTNLLHEIANCAYNYEKCQRINDFIWDKLKKKPSWRKLLKTLNLLDFLLKNGPPSIISSYKHDLYQFKSLYDYSHVSSEGVQRGQSSTFLPILVRQKAKAIVQLLSNQEILDEQRAKAKTIRQRMSGLGGVTNNSTSPNYDTKYQGYDSKNYSKQNKDKNYGQSNLNSAYGDYTVHQSTLSKYKEKQVKTQTKSTANTNTNNTKTVNIVGGTFQQKPSIVQQQQPQQVKKPFQSNVPKLGKPGQRQQAQKQKIDITGGFFNQQKKQELVQPNTKAIVDDDFVFYPQNNQNNFKPAQVQVGQINNPNSSHQHIQNSSNLYQNGNNGISPQQNNQNNLQSQQYYINPMYSTTAPMASQQVSQPMSIYGIGFNNQQHSQGFQNQMQNNYFMNPAGNSIGNQQVQAGLWNYNMGQQNPYINPMYTQTGPMSTTQQTLNMNINNNISHSKPNQKPIEGDFGDFQSGKAQPKVNWLSENEKGLIDFSDFGTQLKKSEQKSGNSKKNNNFDWQW